MPTLLAIVDSATEARSAAAAGAERIALRCRPDAAELAGLRQHLPIPLSLIADDASSPGLWGSALRSSGADDLRWPAEVPIPSLPTDLGGVTVTALIAIEQAVAPGLLDEAAGAGFHGLMLVTPAGSRLHLTEHFDSAALSALITGAKRRGLRIGLSGCLEPPDVPRLAALAPDELGFEVASGSAARLGALRDLMALDPASSGPVQADEPDRIFVRDWVLSMSIGAYARERGTPQRVRLSVDAETTRRDLPAADMRDVVSYDLITDAVRRLAAGHVDLVEAFAEAIAAALLAHPGLARVTVTVEKLDLGAGAVGCRIVRRRAA